MGFRPGTTSSKLLRNKILHHKTRVIIFVAMVCLKHFSNEAIEQKIRILRIRIAQSLRRMFCFMKLVVIS